MSKKIPVYLSELDLIILKIAVVQKLNLNQGGVIQSKTARLLGQIEFELETFNEGFTDDAPNYEGDEV